MLLTSKAEARMEAIIDAIPDLMIEVGLDGTIYNYHSHRKDSFVEYTDQFIGKKISEILPAAAANVAFRQSGKRLKSFSPDINIQWRRIMNCVGLNFP
jgi:hypothetical protein